MEKDSTHMTLKTRLSEPLSTINLIIELYAIFLAILGVIISNTEAILEACIIFVVYIIFEYLNYDVTKITTKGLKNSKYGNLEWKLIYRIERNGNVIYLYTKENKNPYKIYISKKEDSQEISRAYDYMVSKIKSPEKINKNYKKNIE